MAEVKVDKLLIEVREFLSLHINTLQDAQEKLEEEAMDDIFHIGQMKSETAKLYSKILKKTKTIDAIKETRIS